MRPESMQKLATCVSYAVVVYFYRRHFFFFFASGAGSGTVIVLKYSANVGDAVNLPYASANVNVSADSNLPGDMT